MKTIVYNFLNKPYTVILIMLIAPLFGFIDRNFTFFFPLGIVFLLLKGSKFDWSKFGIGQKITKKTVLKSLLFASILFSIFTFLIDPILINWFGNYDLSSINDIRGDFLGYSILLLIVWVFAAFGEELLFRGYYMKGLARLLGNNNKAWIFSSFITSLYFGISHAYQGLIGVVSVFLWSFAISLLFNKNRNNLLLLVLIHGIYDTIGVTFIYLNIDRLISEWVTQLLF
ncbi:CPBP family intramembrane metalloprotease [Polaribacter vadi]|uniref:CPBP family intramembrane glutamic endopeptidase n=1 Tax=Polaribacter TaxID=52959 RepID=UPI001C080472|nr:MULTISPECIES: CPBP family intramembrane glutamic endopeptidase [Polaribacter]MBU3012348.1 CPBP family intramembrane metalloprotease [Polaribacter vadi]MDO6742165.1 CPBP family intramembrane metalloprotease [Polaribacter sp. 1_MG-2023]